MLVMIHLDVLDSGWRLDASRGRDECLDGMDAQLDHLDNG